MTGRLAGRVGLVTGAASGLGHAIAERFATEGAHVVIADIDAAGGERAAEAPRAAASFVALDVTREGSWTATIEAVPGAFGRLDVLGNNAGGAPGGAVERNS